VIRSFRASNEKASTAQRSFVRSYRTANTKKQFYLINIKHSLPCPPLILICGGGSSTKVPGDMRTGHKSLLLLLISRKSGWCAAHTHTHTHPQVSFLEIDQTFVLPRLLACLLVVVVPAVVVRSAKKKTDVLCCF